MNKFYKRLKIFYLIAAFFLSITLIPASIYNAINKNWELVFIVLPTVVLMCAIASFIFLYYKNIVIDVTFEEKNTIIKTNGKVFSLPSEKFIEVNDSKLFGRIFILYKDGEITKKFIFQKKYSPFKSYTLNIDEMKKHMTSAVFKES